VWVISGVLIGPIMLARFDGMLHGELLAVTLQTVRIVTLVAATGYAMSVVARGLSRGAPTPSLVVATHKT
jgi:hypothetical protein